MARCGRKSRYIDNIEKTSKKIWRIAIYIRLSVEDGDDKIESYSVSNQRELLTMYIKEQEDIEIFDIYIDDGYSGTDFNRPNFQRMLQDIKAGNVNAVIVKDLSRLGRNYIEVGNYIEQIFPLYNIRFIALNDNIDSYKDPRSVNNVIVPFKNLMNDEYCRDISNKVKSVINAKKRRGEFCAGIAPYGYIKDPEDKHHLIIDEESAKVVRLIFKKTLEGKGRLIIARELNQMGILGPNDYKRLVLKIKCGNGVSNSKTKGIIGWNVGQITKILKNEVYCGDMIQCRHRNVSYKIHKLVANDKKDWIIVRNTHEAIISREDFNKVQDIILSRDNRVTNFGVLTLFSGFLRCNDCHRGMTRKRGGQKHDGSGEYNYVYYCNTYTRKSPDLCSMHKIRSDKIEELVLKTIRVQAKLILNIEETIKEISKSKKISYDKDILIQSIKKLEVELDKKKALKKSVYEDWKLDIISKDEYLEYVSEYEDDIKKLQDNIEELNKKSNLYNQDKKEDNKWIEVFRKNQDITKLTREILSELINVIYIHEGENITIEFKYENEYKQALKFLKENKEYIEKIKGNQILMEKIQSVQKFLESSDVAV